MSLLAEINNHVSLYRDKDMPMNPSYAKTQEAIIDLIDSYWMNKFLTGDRTSSGLRKVFSNLVNNPTFVARKMLDFDTKDIQIMTEPGHSYWDGWYLKMELNQWMKDTSFGLFLNDLVFQLPKYGHVVIKRVGSELKLVNIKNIIINPAADDIRYVPVVEEHHMPESKLREMEEYGWVVPEDLSGFEKDDNGFYIIYEYFNPASTYVDEDGDTVNYCIAAKTKKTNEKGVTTSEFFSGNKMKHPYREIRFEKVPGRWLGRGTVETLFENQIAGNEVANMFHEALQWSSKKIFQTRDETVARNLLGDADNGEVMVVNEELNLVDTTERSLGAFQYAESKWSQSAQANTFSFDAVRSQRPPAGTPLGTTIIQAQQAASHFDIPREDIGIHLSNLFFEEIIPMFKKSVSSEHFLSLFSTGEDIDKFDTFVANTRAMQRVVDEAKSSGKFPLGDELDLIKALELEKLKSSGRRDVKIPEGYYDNLKYKVKIVISGEQIDIAARLNILTVALQTIGPNPSLLRDPFTRKVFFKILDLSGVSPQEIAELEDSTLLNVASDQVAERGGSIAAPATPTATPTTIPTNQAV